MFSYVGDCVDWLPFRQWKVNCSTSYKTLFLYRSTALRGLFGSWYQIIHLSVNCTDVACLLTRIRNANSSLDCEELSVVSTAGRLTPSTPLYLNVVGQALSFWPIPGGEYKMRREETFRAWSRSCQWTKWPNRSAPLWVLCSGRLTERTRRKRTVHC